MKKNKKYAATVPNDGIERTDAPVRQPRFNPYPAAQSAGASIMMPNNGPFAVAGNSMPMGLPTYTTIDEYGRAYSPNVFYGPQTHSAPVPVAVAPAICQLNPIVTPLAFVPYGSQSQPLYTYDDENNNK